MNCILRCLLAAVPGLLLSGPSNAVLAGEFVLVDRGVDPAPIVVSKNASPRTREAAEELAGYIEKISGKRPVQLDGEPKRLPQRAIWVGVQPAVQALFPGVDFSFRHPEEIFLAANDNHLVIAGRDRWDPQRSNVKGPEGTVRNKQQEYGTVNAVYTFLQDKLGVRWFWPGELGEDFATRAVIRIAPFEYRYHPRIRSRAGVMHFSSLDEIKGYGRSHDWLRLQRLQLHSIDMGGGHGFGDWWDRFHQTQPDFFALQPDGTRSGFPEPHNAKLCESNAAVWDQWLADVEMRLANDSTQTIFNASPNDGWASGHCVCEKCRAWDHPDGEPRLFHWAGRRETRPALTDRDITFANHLGKLLQQRYPNKDYRVLMMAYGHSRPAPVGVAPANNVIISSVANFLGRTNLVDRGSTRGDTHRQQFAAWAKAAPLLMWRPNTGSPAGWQQGLPDVSLKQTIEDFRLVGQSPCIGIFIDSVWEHWATQGPQYYLMAQLTWDPNQDGSAILRDYYSRAFGPAAEHIQAYFATYETARMAFVAKHGYESDVFAFTKLYTPQLLTEAEKHLQRAIQAAGDQNVYRRRIEFVNVGLEYTRLVADNCRLMSGYWNKPDADVAAQVKENWVSLNRLVAAHPHAINGGPVRPGTPRMAGLHPDYPNRKAKKPSAKPAANDLDQN